MSGYYSTARPEVEANSLSPSLTHTHISEVIAAIHLSHVSYISVCPQCLPVSPRTQTSPQCPLKLDNANGWICKRTHTHTHTLNVFVYQAQAHQHLPCYLCNATHPPSLSPNLPSPERQYILGLRQFALTCLRAAVRLIGGAVGWCGVVR